MVTASVLGGVDNPKKVSKACPGGFSTSAELVFRAIPVIVRYVAISTRSTPHVSQLSTLSLGSTPVDGLGFMAHVEPDWDVDV